jgi:signal transduction histidine kinase
MSVWSVVLLGVLATAFGATVVWLLAERERKALVVRVAELEAELRAAQASNAQVMHTTKLASLGQMVAGVTHEINTPLGFVKSNVEVVRDLIAEHEAMVAQLLSGVDLLVGADPATLARAREVLTRARVQLAQHAASADARELLDDAIEGLKSISNLVQNLKGFARVDRDGMDSVDLNDCVRAALNVAQHQLRDRIDVATEFGALPRVRCMPSQMNQVFLNLITNAAQAMPGEHGTLSLRTRDAGEFVEVAVTDTGAGIPDDVLPKIFDPFFTTKPVGEGTGLGLSIVHKIIKSHGGTIHVRTAVGEGTTFTISLPVEQRASNVTPLRPAGRAA